MWPFLTALLALGCGPKPTIDPPAARVVEAPAAAIAGGQRGAMLQVLSRADASACYADALTRDSRAHGDVVVRFTLGADGAVRDSRVAFSTLADDGAERCVASSILPLRFEPGREGLRVEYAFVFYSASTPPEVVRALKIRYGLQPEEVPEDLADPRRKPPAGIVRVW
jgi:hypothetical protein